MSSPSTNFGASVVPTTQHTAANETLTAPTTLDSPVLTPAASHEDLHTSYDQKPIPPHSPFYQHPPASFERAATHSRSASHDMMRTASSGLNEKDVEAGQQDPTLLALQRGDDAEKNPFTSKVSVDCNKECRMMWPSRQTLMQSKAARQKSKRDKKMCGGCGPVVECWQRRSKREKLAISIALALFLIGVIVAIAVGISVAVNGTYFQNNNSSSKIAGT